MNVCLTAHNSKKVLLENFCIAYKGILKKHHLVATFMTGQHIEKASGLSVDKFLPGEMGGGKQLQNEIINNDIDMVIFFHGQEPSDYDPTNDFAEINRLCDVYNIPLATNIATAESLILCLDRGDLEWRG